MYRRASLVPDRDTFGHSKVEIHRFFMDTKMRQSLCQAIASYAFAEPNNMRGPGAGWNEARTKTYNSFQVSCLGTKIRPASQTRTLASRVLRTRLKPTHSWSFPRAHAEVDLNPAYGGLAGAVYARRGDLCCAQSDEGRRIPEA